MATQLPNRDLPGDVDAISLSTTPETVQYLAGAVADFLAQSHLHRQRWSKRSLAQEIASTDPFGRQLSDTTLGRFLDPRSKQQPSDDTVDMIGRFLLRNGWVSERELRLIDAAPNVRLVTALAGFFAVPETRAQTTFLDALEGRYVGWSSAGDWLAFHSVLLRPLPGTGALRAVETLRLFQIAHPDSVIRKLEDGIVAPVQLGRVVQALGGRERAAFSAAGGMIADPSVGLFLLRGAAAGFPSHIGIEAILYRDDDPIGFQGQRFNGWQPLDYGSFLLPTGINAASAPATVLRHLSREVLYRHRRLFAAQGLRIDERPDISPGPDRPQRGFAASVLRDVFALSAVEIAENTRLLDAAINDAFDLAARGIISIDARLLIAIDLSALAAFRRLLADGANPNTVRPATGLPMAFELAERGWTDWIEALADAGRFNALLTDSAGRPASFRAGTLAREHLWLDGEDEIGARYAESAVLLAAAELRQRYGSDAANAVIAEVFS